MFEFVSKEFDNVKTMESEKKRLIIELCDYIGAEREGFKLQRGNVKLMGNINGKWVVITSKIGDFKEYIIGKTFSMYRLESRLRIKNN